MRGYTVRRRVRGQSLGFLRHSKPKKTIHTVRASRAAATRSTNRLLREQKLSGQKRLKELRHSAPKSPASLTGVRKQIVGAVDAYADRKHKRSLRDSRVRYTPMMRSLYREAAHRAADEIERGKPAHRAISEHFEHPLEEVVLKAVGHG